MNAILDFTSIVLVLLIITISTYFLIEFSNEGKKKDALYAECIATKYDKFQCYSMIYGDK